MNTQKAYLHKNVTKPETSRIQAMGWDTTEWLEIWDKGSDWYQRHTNPDKRTHEMEIQILLYLRHTPKKGRACNTVEAAKNIIKKRLRPVPSILE